MAFRVKGDCPRITCSDESFAKIRNRVPFSKGDWSITLVGDKRSNYSSFQDFMSANKVSCRHDDEDQRGWSGKVIDVINKVIPVDEFRWRFPVPAKLGYKFIPDQSLYVKIPADCSVTGLEQLRSAKLAEVGGFPANRLSIPDITKQVNEDFDTLKNLIEKTEQKKFGDIIPGGLESAQVIFSYDDGNFSACGISSENYYYFAKCDSS